MADRDPNADRSSRPDLTENIDENTLVVINNTNITSGDSQGEEGSAFGPGEDLVESRLEDIDLDWRCDKIGYHS